jgi:hypothetical protein
MSESRASRVSAAGADALRSLLLPNGRFVYGYERWPEKKPLKGYNLLRHAGAVWAMVTCGGESFKPAARRALNYLQSKYHMFPDGSLGVESRDRVKLGGNGLAILAHLAIGAPEDLELAEKLGDLLLTQQREDGDFHHKIRTNREVMAFESDYYTGEILFGLILLHKATGERRFLEACDKAVKHLAPMHHGVEEQSHWMLYFLAEHWQITRSEDSFGLACLIANDIMTNTGYRTRRRSTPTACRSEGLLAFHRLAKLARDAALAARVLSHVVEDCNEQHRFYRGGFFIGGDEDQSVRIDYIQHNICAFGGLAEAQGA